MSCALQGERAAVELFWLRQLRMQNEPMAFVAAPSWDDCSTVLEIGIQFNDV